MNRLQLALDYHIKKDWNVLPLFAWNKHPQGNPDSAGKSPTVAWKKYQTVKSTEDEIVSWFTHTDNNVGILTGKVSNLTVIDVDTEDSNVLNQLKLPKTYTVKTRKGYHFYYQYNENISNDDLRTPDGKHVGEFRSEGGLVVAAGSKHQTGFIYKVLNDVEPVPFPAHLLSSHKSEKKDYKKISEGISEGNRTNSAKSYIGELVRLHYPNKQKTWEIAINWNKTNEPPLGEEQIKSLLVYCWSKENEKKGVIKKETFNPIELGNLMLETPDPAPFIVDSLIKKQSLNLIHGATGCGKSMFVLKLVDAVTTGEKFLGEFNVVKSKCLIIDLEMTRDDCIVRAKDIVTPGNESLILCEKSWRIDDKNSSDWLKEYIVSNNIELLVLDTFSKIHTVDENSNSSITPIMVKLMEICNEFKITIILLHHVNKNAEAKGLSRGRGATAIADNAGSYLEISSKKLISPHGDNYLSMTVSNEKNRRLESIGKFILIITNKKSDGRTVFEYIGVAAEEISPVNNAREEIMRLVNETPGITKTEINKKLKDTAGPRPTKNAIDSLIGEGKIHVDLLDRPKHRLYLGREQENQISLEELDFNN